MNGVEMVGPSTTKLHSKPTFALSNDGVANMMVDRSLKTTYKICFNMSDNVQCG